MWKRAGMDEGGRHHAYHFLLCLDFSQNEKCFVSINLFSLSLSPLPQWFRVLFFSHFSYFTDIFCVDIRIRCNQSTDTLTVTFNGCIVERSLSTQSAHTHTSPPISHDITSHTNCNPPHTNPKCADEKEKRVSPHLSPLSLSLSPPLPLSLFLWHQTW